MPSLSLPLFDVHDPTFYRGATAQTRRTSHSGAVAAQKDRATKIATLRRLWRSPATIQEMASIAGVAISSVCSLKQCLGDDLIEVGEREQYWPDGRVTKRTVFQIVDRVK